MNYLRVLIRKECIEDVFSARGFLLYVLWAMAFSIFSILLIANTELSLLDNAQAVYLMSGLNIALGLLMTVIRGSDGFAGERDRDTLETLLITPISGHSLAIAKLTGILFSWILLFIISVPYLWSVGSRGQNLGQSLAYLFFAGTSIVLGFGSLMLGLSACMRSFRGVLSTGVTIFLLCAIPMVLGPSLRQSNIGKFFDWLNPFAVAMNMIDSVVIDSQGLVHQIIPLVVLTAFPAVAFWMMKLTTKRIAL